MGGIDRGWSLSHSTYSQVTIDQQGVMLLDFGSSPGVSLAAGRLYFDHNDKRRRFEISPLRQRKMLSSLVYKVSL